MKRYLKIQPGDIIKEIWYDGDIIVYLILETYKDSVLVKRLNKSKTIIELYSKEWLIAKDTYATRIKIPKLKAMLLYEI